MTHGILIRNDATPTLNSLYDTQTLQPISSTNFVRMKELQFVNNDNEYIVNNDINNFTDNQIFSQYLQGGIPANKIGLFKLEGSDYRLNGLINMPEIEQAFDTPVLINLNIKIIDNL